MPELKIQLELKQVVYDYEQEQFEFSLQIAHGEIIALMGPSGAGKSTLLSLVAGFIQPATGEITVNGQSILDLAPYQRPFSMLFQEHNLFGHLTVRDNIALGINPSLKLSTQQKQQVIQAATQVGIVELLDRIPHELSGGQRQRVALARCFVQANPIWLLDEPFSALDPILRAEMLSLVRQLAEERSITVVMVTHHVSDARAIADSFAFIADYRVVEKGEIETLNASHTNRFLAEFVRVGE